jgi:glucokinase
VMATGGIYVGGGIAPKILPKLEAGAFMRAFVDKGRFRHLLERIPVRVILNEKAALLGAARCAAAALANAEAPGERLTLVRSR